MLWSKVNLSGMRLTTWSRQWETRSQEKKCKEEKNCFLSADILTWYGSQKLRPLHGKLRATHNKVKCYMLYIFLNLKKGRKPPIVVSLCHSFYLSIKFILLVKIKSFMESHFCSADGLSSWLAPGSGSGSGIIIKLQLRQSLGRRSGGISELKSVLPNN